MSKIYYGDRASGGSLKHYRTKGSRNGYSKNPKYRPVGQRAKGQWVNGRYVYQSSSPLERGGYNQIQNDKLLIKNADKYKAMARGVAGDYNRASERAASLASINARKAAKGAQNNWQQKANREAAASRSQVRLQNDSSKAAYIPRRHGGDMYVNPSNFEIDTERKPNKTPGANAMRNDPRYDVYGSTKIEAAKQEAAKKIAPKNYQNSLAPKTAMGRRVDTMRIVEDPKGGTRYGTEIIDPRYRVDGTQKIEKAKQEAARKAKEKETNGQYFTFDEKTGRTVKTSPGIEAEKARIAAGKKRHAKVRANREKAAKRAALINKIKDKISSFFKKKK